MYIALWMPILGFGSGFPLLFSSQIFRAWLLDTGASIHAIGLVSLLTLPYILSFLWTPFLDYWVYQGITTRKHLIAFLFMASGCCLYVFSWLDPSVAYYSALSIGLLLAIFSSTQDRLIDAYRLVVLPPDQQNLGIASSTVFFRIAVMIAGGGCLIFSSQLGWSGVYRISSALMFLLSIGILCSPVDTQATKSTTLNNHLVKCYHILKACIHDRYFMVFLLSYRMSIFWLEAMMPVFLGKYLGMSLYEIGLLYKVYGMFGLLAGSFLMGWLMLSHPVRSLFLMCLSFQFFLGIGFYASTVFSVPHSLVGLLVLGECFLQGMLGTLSILWLSQQPYGKGTSFSFALWNGLGSIGRVFAGPVAAFVITNVGWKVYMLLAIAMSLVALHISSIYFSSDSEESAVLDSS